MEIALSPEAPFPTALNECFALYKWLLVKANAQSLGLSDVPRIILAGDSAGANLCCSTSIRVCSFILSIFIFHLINFMIR